MKLLFICTANVNRSLTAEKLFGQCPNMETKSAGTHPFPSRNRITQELIDWAEIIFVMSEKNDGHHTYITTHFDTTKTTIHDLNIKDVYMLFNPKLEKLLVERVGKYIDLKSCKKALFYMIEG